MSKSRQTIIIMIISNREMELKMLINDTFKCFRKLNLSHPAGVVVLPLVERKEKMSVSAEFQ